MPCLASTVQSYLLSPANPSKAKLIVPKLIKVNLRIAKPYTAQHGIAKKIDPLIRIAKPGKDRLGQGLQ